MRREGSFFKYPLLEIDDYHVLQHPKIDETIFME
jgi:hypothetical protein